MATSDAIPHEEAGPNYQLSVRSDRIVQVTVRKRADLSRERGSDAALMLAKRVLALIGGERGAVHGLWLDLRAAPERWGVVTNGALRDIFAACERSAVPLALLSVDGMQAIHLRHLVAGTAPRTGACFADEAAAAAHLGRPR